MRHTAFSSILTLLAVVLCYGCLPAPITYHEPSALGGELVNSVCHYMAPKDTIEFRIDGITAKIKGQNNWLSINIYIPEGKIAQFESDEIGIYEDKPENMKTFKIDRSAYFDGDPNGYVKVRPTEILIGRTKPLIKYGRAGDRLFEMTVQLDEKTRDHFYVKLPKLYIDKKPYEFPVIEFMKKTGVGIMPINC